MTQALKQPDESMTVAEFLAWDPGDGQAYQPVNGEPQAMAPASPAHGMLQSPLDRKVGAHLDDLGGPCFVVTTSGFVPQVLGKENMRVPDLAVSCSPPEDGYIHAPVLLIEVLSPSNRAGTWFNVWAYATIPSVRETLVLHSLAVRADVLRRQPDGGWPDNPDAVLEGDLVPDSIGFRTPLLDLCRNTRMHPGTAA